MCARSPLEQAAAELRDGGGQAIAVRTDVTRLDEVEALDAATLAEFGAVHINSTSSMAGLLAVPRLGAYSVAKHGVVALMATLERELGPPTLPCAPRSSVPGR